MVYANELQRNAPWGLSRVSHVDPLTFKNYQKYEYEADGEGVKVYVIDTGINVDHIDFDGRAIWGKTVPSGDSDSDGNGHGSHCAGTISGSRYGVAKKAIPVAVKVLRSNGSGSMSVKKSFTIIMPYSLFLVLIL
jgi:cerevisin